MAASPPPPAAVAASNASVVGHSTLKEDKRFTVYTVELNSPKGKFSVFRRYSEFRDLFDKLKEVYPNELDKFKFPSKRLLGNFDASFLETRRKRLNDFVRLVVAHPVISQHALVKQFLFETPRHGRGHERHLSDETFAIDAADEGEGDADSRWDLGDGENKKASVHDLQMLSVIGKGSFGKVLLAKHKDTGKVYAVKVLNKDAIIKQNEVKHIMSERNVLLGNVHHPFLVGLHYSFQTPSKLFFVLDYVNGGELFFHLQREKRFPVARARFYAAEITSALEYMHSLNIVYRDLKPENILLDSTGHVVLTDFGLCKENVEPGQTTATFCGTPEYLAPEVLKKHSYGRPVDWWCLGCVTFEMMCGLPPFYSRDVNEMYERILHDKLRFPDHVPAKARSFLEGLLVRIPDQRLGGGPEDAEEVMRHPFFEDLDWDKLYRKEIEPPFNPNVDGHLDLKNFDPEFVNEPVPSSVMPHSQELSVSVKQADGFEGFSFVGHSQLNP